MPELPPDATPRRRLHHPHRLPGGVHRCLLQHVVGPLGLPGRHALPHSHPHRPHRVWVRRHRPGRRGAGPRQELPGVPAQGLLIVAEEQGREPAVLEHHQPVRDGIQGLRKDCDLDSCRLPCQSNVSYSGSPCSLGSPIDCTFLILPSNGQGRFCSPVRYGGTMMYLLFAHFPEQNFKKVLHLTDLSCPTVTSQLLHRCTILI